VFGGGGGADFMSKMTQGFAATFMICAMYLAYASAHAGSAFLESADDGTEGLLEADEDINYERLGPRAQPLPTAEEGKAMQAKAAVTVPAQTEAPPSMIEDADPDPASPAVENVAPSDTPPVDGERGDSPDDVRGDSPQSGKESLQNAPLDDKKTNGDNAENDENDDKTD
jgi:preprotein translocase subunit SecG